MDDLELALIQQQIVDQLNAQQQEIGDDDGSWEARVARYDEVRREFWEQLADELTEQVAAGGGHGVDIVRMTDRRGAEVEVIWRPTRHGGGGYGDTPGDGSDETADTVTRVSAVEAGELSPRRVAATGRPPGELRVTLTIEVADYRVGRELTPGVGYWLQRGAERAPGEGFRVLQVNSAYVSRTPMLAVDWTGEALYLLADADLPATVVSHDGATVTLTSDSWTVVPHRGQVRITVQAGAELLAINYVLDERMVR